MPRAARVTAEGLTLKEEAMVQAFLRLGDKSLAYVEAYKPKTEKADWIRKKAHMIFDIPCVDARLKQLIKMSESSAVFGLDQAMAEAREAFDLAKKIEQPSAMVSATKLRATLMGIIIEKKEVTSRTVKDLPDDELEKLFEKSLYDAGYAIRKAKA